MLQLKQYEWKKIMIKTKTGESYSGYVGDYIAPEENENRQESIILDIVDRRLPVEFYESDILSIEVLS